MTLQDAVAAFARTTLGLSEQDMELAWEWGDYDEGLRFAFFRTYEELRDLAAELMAQRHSLRQHRTLAQHRMAQYHAAYQDLQAVLLGVTDDLAAQPPGEDQWPVQRVVAHMVEAERSFFAVTHYAVERVRAMARSGGDQPLALSDEGWDAFWAAANDLFDDIKDTAPLSTLLQYYETLHHRVLAYYTEASDSEMDAPSVFWESTPMPVEFRLHRFDSHLRQHTIQVEKALYALTGEPSESRRLLRLIYAALAEVQGVLLVSASSPAAGFEAPDCERLTAIIRERTAEIAAILEAK